MGDNLQRPEVVLVVDDDEDCRVLAKLALRRAGFRVVTSIGGQQALEALSGLRPDAVVLDVQMPDVSGPAIWEWLQFSPGHGEVAVVFWTASGLPTGSDIDGAPVVQKGTSLATLAGVVSEQISRVASQRSV